MVGAASRRSPSTVGVLGSFMVTASVVVVVLAAVLVWVQHQAAVTEAVRDARSLTALQARDVVAEALTDDALVPGPAQQALDEVVRTRVLGDHVVRVKVWDASGRVVYSDDETLVGRTFELAADERELLEQGGAPVAEVSDLKEAENAEEAAFGRLLQVYVSVQTPEGTPLLYEAYHRYDSIDAATAQSLRTSLPPLLGGLLLLWALQAPLAWHLARRLRRAHEEREGLLLQALGASDQERRRIAADLHDGVVQGLSGTALSLSAAAAAATERGQPSGPLLRATADDLRRWVRELRTLVVTVTPPALHDQGLHAALVDLAAVLEVRGCAVDVAVGKDLGPGALDLPTESLVFRTAQEAVRNVVKHADAASVQIHLVRDVGGIVLEVCDDGRGFDPQAVRPRRSASVGLELLTSLAAEQGGSCTLRSAPGQGTRLTLQLPLSQLPLSRPADGGASVGETGSAATGRTPGRHRARRSSRGRADGPIEVQV